MPNWLAHAVLLAKVVAGILVEKTKNTSNNLCALPCDLSELVLILKYLREAAFPLNLTLMLC